jgi:hypothetical protein
MFKATYKSVEIEAPEKHYLPLLQAWYDELPQGQVKDAIRAIRWREFQPQIAGFRLIALCPHPFREDVVTWEAARKQNDSEVLFEAATKLMNRFEGWIDRAEMPREITIDGRPAGITWSSQEMPYFDRDSLPPQERAQHDLNRQAARFLWLVKVSSQGKDEFVRAVYGTNIPFGSAGLLLTGQMRPIRRFPAGFPDSDAELERLRDNILDEPDEFVILMRLAQHMGCHQGVVARSLAAIDHFLNEHTDSLNEWLQEYERTKADDDLLDDELFTTTELYGRLDAACEHYRHALLAVVEGHEPELIEVLNSFLPQLPVPESPFRREIEDETDWWKRGEE